MACLYLRKRAEVQISVSMLTKMGCRGAVAGLLSTMLVEFIRLPFHNYMKDEENAVGRVFAVIFWVAFVALFEEIVKIGTVALGLKRSSTDDEALPAASFAHFIAESPRAVALCGLAAGIGFTCIENIPRFYEVALDQPLVGITQSSFGQGSQESLVGEGMLRFGRVWTFVFWSLLNLQPWLTGLAALELAKVSGKGPIAPMDWFSVLKVVFILHFCFDLLDRSSNTFVEFIGCLTIPYAMNTFRKTWDSLDTRDGLLQDSE